MTSYLLDTRGTICPIPVIRTQDKVADLVDGDELEVLCSDPGALHDIPAWCRIHGHKLGHARQRDDGVISIQVFACKA